MPAQDRWRAEPHDRCVRSRQADFSLTFSHAPKTSTGCYKSARQSQSMEDNRRFSGTSSHLILSFFQAKLEAIFLDVNLTAVTAFRELTDQPYERLGDAEVFFRRSGGEHRFDWGLADDDAQNQLLVGNAGAAEFLANFLQ